MFELAGAHLVLERTPSMSSDQHVSIRAIAALAGVSHVTVSRVLRHDPHVAPATRERVLEIARKHAYRPNPLVSALMVQLRSNRRRVLRPEIAFLLHWHHRDGWKDSSTKMLQHEGASERASELGYKLTDFAFGSSDMKSKRLSQILISRWVQGVLVAPQENTGETFDFDWRPFAIATIAYSHPHQPFHRACHDYLRGMRTALRQAADLGYRRIGYLTFRGLEDRVDGNWFSGYAAYQAQSRTHVPGALFLSSRPADDVPAFRQWLTTDAPEVIITAYPEIMTLLKHAGCRVPQDISVIHLDVPPGTSGIRFSGIDQRHRLIGAAAVDQIVEQIVQNSRGLAIVPKTIQIPGVWVEGDTLRPMPR